MSRTFHANSKGLTLVEVLAALFLIALGVLAAAPMFVHAMQGNATGADFGSVGALAQHRLEVLRAQPYSSLNAGGSLTVDQAGYFDRSNAGFVVRWLIENNAALANTKIITVRAESLRAMPGPRREVTITSLRGR